MRTRTGLSVAALLAVVAAATWAGEPDNGGDALLVRVRGKVVHRGARVPGARIEVSVADGSDPAVPPIGPLTMRCDAQGEFAFTVPEGKYSIEVMSERGSMWTAPIDIYQLTEWFHLDIDLPAHELRVDVLGADGAPIGAIEVLLRGENPARYGVGSQFTTDSGRATIPYLRAGVYALTIAYEDSVISRHRVVVEGGDCKLGVRLPQLGDLSVRVVGRDGRPVAVNFTIEPHPGQPEAVVQHQSARWRGRFTLPAGSWRMVVSDHVDPWRARLRDGASFPFRIEPGKHTKVVARLSID